MISNGGKILCVVDVSNTIIVSTPAGGKAAKLEAALRAITGQRDAGREKVPSFCAAGQRSITRYKRFAEMLVGELLLQLDVASVHTHVVNLAGTQMPE